MVYSVATHTSGEEESLTPIELTLHAEDSPDLPATVLAEHITLMADDGSGTEISLNNGAVLGVREDRQTILDRIEQSFQSTSDRSRRNTP